MITKRRPNTTPSPMGKSSRCTSTSTLKRRNFKSKWTFFPRFVVLSMIIVSFILYCKSRISSNVKNEEFLASLANNDNFIGNSKIINEERFTKTLQDCNDVVGSTTAKTTTTNTDTDTDTTSTDHKNKKNKCGHFKFANTSNDKIQRIAIISPPSPTIDEFVLVLKSALLAYYEHDIPTFNREFEIIRTTHVPPYGYGKNHGYTKIIRVRNDSLLLEVVSSMMEIDKVQNASIYKKKKKRKKRKKKLSKSIMKVWNENLLKQSLRQIVRWHCRLSHVAAHTTMYNLEISTIDLVNEMSDILRMILADPEKDVNYKIDERKFKDAVQMIQDSQIELLIDSLLTDVKEELNGLVRKEKYVSMSMLSSVLEKELDSTNDLKKWPCSSFWDVADDENVKMEDYANELAKELSPSCSDPLTTCSVNKDKCEQRGDAKCK